MKRFSPLHLLIARPNNEISFHKDQLSCVFKAPKKGYFCGMCGKQFCSLNAAWDCVIKDTLNLKSLPVVDVNRHEGCFIRCLLCGKNYVNAEDAALCLVHNLQALDLPILLNEHLKSLAINTLQGQKLTRRKNLYSRHSTLPMKASNPTQPAKQTSPNMVAIYSPKESPLPPLTSSLEEIEVPPKKVDYEETDPDILNLKK